MGVIKELYFELMKGEELMNLRTDQSYFDELYALSQIDDNYHVVMMKLFETEFYSLVDHDENREKDGLEIREELGGELSGPARLLEVLLGICKRMDFNLCDSESERVPWKDSFEEIFENLGLDELTDEGFCSSWMPEKLDKIVKNLLDRKYKKNGIGGFFPVKRCKADQREIEIWYQMQQYIIENYPN